MGRRTPPKRRGKEKPHDRSVALLLEPRLRRELGDALAETAPDVKERLTRTALLSKREAHRYLDELQGGAIPDEVAVRARDVIDKLSAAA